MVTPSVFFRNNLDIKKNSLYSFIGEKNEEHRSRAYGKTANAKYGKEWNTSNQ